MNQDKTISYYNSNAQEFVEGTANVDFSAVQNKFMDKLPNGAKILDFGCGSGRDTKCFLEQGYDVEAIDGSEELCKLASQYTGIGVKHMYFQELDEVEKYDAVWACSSILHLSYEDLGSVMNKITCALKEEGLLYTSFKYGEYEGLRNGRYFTDMTEESMAELLVDFPELRVEKQWITGDVRAGRGDERWLNMILRK